MSERNRNGSLSDFVAAARAALSDSNWYAAIALAMSLPDICASIDRPGPGISRDRYAEWWTQRVAGWFWIKPDPGEEWTAHSLLTGNDAYFLRCAFLHSGTGTPDDRRRVKERFRFMLSPSRSYGQSRDEREVSLNVSYLVEAVCQGVEQWLLERSADPVAQARLAEVVGIIPSAITIVDYQRHERNVRCSSAKAAGRAEMLAELETFLGQLPVEQASGLARWVRCQKARATRELIDARNIVGRLP